MNRERMKGLHFKLDAFHTQEDIVSLSIDECSERCMAAAVESVSVSAGYRSGGVCRCWTSFSWSTKREVMVFS